MKTSTIILLILFSTHPGFGHDDEFRTRTTRQTSKLVCGAYFGTVSGEFSKLKIRHNNNFKTRTETKYGAIIRTGTWKLQNDTLILCYKLKSADDNNKQKNKNTTIKLAIQQGQWQRSPNTYGPVKRFWTTKNIYLVTVAP